MLKALKEQVFEANLELVRQGLVLYTWGNVSGIDRKNGLVAIKPSGVSYDEMRPQHMVIVDLWGRVVEGIFKPSSDTPTHLELYRAFGDIGGVAHTHSTYATAYAQAGVGVRAMGTTHADYFYGDVPCTRGMTPEEIGGAYEKNTGLVICECFAERDPMQLPAVLVANHGPFSWGADAADSVYHAVVLEQVARMNYLTAQINPGAGAMPTALLDKHFLRKHGANAYYGQG